MLVIMHDWNVQFSLQATFNFKSLWGFNVFKIDSSKRRSNGLNGRYKLIHIGCVYLNIKHIDVCENLEKNGFTLHDRLACFRANVAQTKHRSSIGNDRNKIALGCVLVYIFGIRRNLHARLCYSRAVGQRQILLRTMRLCRNDLYFPFPRPTMVIQRLLLRR